MPQRRWTDEQLADAVTASSSLREVSTALGLKARNYEWLRKHITRIGVDATHLQPRRRRTWTDEQLRDAVREEHSTAAVVRRLGGVPSGGMHRFIVAHIRRLELDTSHFRRHAWARGRSFTGARLMPLDEILVRGSTYSSAALRKRLIAAGLKPDCCEICELQEWRGERLPLALDHVNGDHTDNRLDNLRILCPNCHSTTKTWCGRKNKKPA